jgi:hypothetical protein
MREETMLEDWEAGSILWTGEIDMKLLRYDEAAMWL